MGSLALNPNIAYQPSGVAVVATEGNIPGWSLAMARNCHGTSKPSPCHYNHRVQHPSRPPTNAYREVGTPRSSVNENAPNNGDRFVQIAVRVVTHTAEHVGDGWNGLVG